MTQVYGAPARQAAAPRGQHRIDKKSTKGDRDNALAESRRPHKPKSWDSLVCSLASVLMSKCVPVLYCGSECCLISKSQFCSLEFALRGSFIKIFILNQKILFTALWKCLTFKARTMRNFCTVLCLQGTYCAKFVEFAEKELRGYSYSDCA